jgi:branched-chain amino acid transport system substrate-binding protein
VFTEALSRVEGVLTPDSLIEAFYSLSGFETGILPPVRFTRDQHLGVNAVQPMQLAGGVWAPLGAPEALPNGYPRSGG